MPRGKKKATAAEAPPNSPPSAKKRKMSASSTKATVGALSSTERRGSRPSTRAAGRTAVTNGKKSVNKNINVGTLDVCGNCRVGTRNGVRNGLTDINVIDPSGFQRFCEDVGADITGALPFIISWKLGATRVFHISRDEWVHGMKELKVDTLDKMKAILPFLETYTSQSCAEETFAELYNWTFSYLKEGGMRKVVDLDTAIPILQVLLVDRENKHIAPFVEFLQQTPPPVKSLNKDQWESFYVFSRSVDDNFTGYSEEAAWPIVIDEYVAWRREQQ